MPRAAHLGDWIGLIALTALWGTAFMFNELALVSFSPGELVLARIGMAAVVLTAFLVMRGRRLPRPGRAWFALAVMALLGNVLPFQLIAWAQQTIDSAVTGVLMAAMPLFVLTLSHFFIPGNHLTPARLTGFGLGFFGVILVIGPQTLSGLGEHGQLLAMLAALGAALSYSVNSIVARRIGARDPITTAAGMMLVAALLMVPVGGPGLIQLEAAPTGMALASVAVLGLLSTGLATVIYFRIVQGPGPAFLSLVNYLVPVWAVLAGSLVLDEQLSPSVFAGLAFILAGIALSEIGARWRTIRYRRARRRVLARTRQPVQAG
jgi:drug/metabolite transporter (DMT)-like permease